MLPHATERLDRWHAARRATGALLAALDYDGTLSPIVEDPEAATLPARTRRALERLARRPDTRVAVLSGRALADVQARVGLPRVICAGNHGLEIGWPEGTWHHPDAEAARPALAACAAALRDALRDGPGIHVEDKTLSLAVHYRRAPDPDAARAHILQAARTCTTGSPALRLTGGKRVINVLPPVEWDKGRALQTILTRLRLPPGAPILYIGDDETDETAFRALAGRGDGIIVADAPPPTTAARAYLRSPDEVAALLEALAEDGIPAAGAHTEG